MKDFRIWRSPHSRFGSTVHTLAVPGGGATPDAETITANAAYTDTELAGIAAAGFNAIWVHGLLRDITRQRVFPEFGADADAHVDAMRQLIGRAGAHGIKIFLYMQPPRGIDDRDAFWNGNRDVAGSGTPTDGVIVRSLCTATPRVQEYLRQASRNLVESLPGLGGVILITASEFPAHCWARGGRVADASGHYRQTPIDCPRCSTRDPADSVIEVIRSVRDGIRSVSADTEIMVWNWSWVNYEPDPCPGIIGRLPADVVFMADFERGGEMEILGRRRPVDEYSLAYPGPSPRFVKSVAEAGGRGLRTMAKLQLGATHELGTVPNLPLLFSIYQKARYLRDNPSAGFMGCWNFGNMRTANTAAFNRFLALPSTVARPEAELAAFAAEYFPGCAPDRVVEAWRRFSDAMRSYPFALSFLYSSPLNYAPAYPLKPAPTGSKPCGASWLIEPRGGNLENCLRDFSLSEVIGGLGRLHRQWRSGVVMLEQGLRGCRDAHATEELSNAKCCRHVFRSAWNVFRVYKLRRDWSAARLDAYSAIIRDELSNLQGLLPLLEADPRLGFHAEAAAYMFDPPSVRRKIRNLRRQLGRQQGDNDPNRPKTERKR